MVLNLQVVGKSVVVVQVHFLIGGNVLNHNVSVLLHDVPIFAIDQSKQIVIQKDLFVLSALQRAALVAGIYQATSCSVKQRSMYDFEATLAAHTLYQSY